MGAIAAPLTRVLLRYVIGAWVTKAGLSIDVNDPNLFEVLNFMIGGLLAATTEGWYVMAHKYGWSR